MRLARHHELVHEDHPRADLQAPGGHEARQPRLGVGPHLEVVVDHRGLAVEQEPRVGGIALEEVEQVVDEVHELDPVRLERRVPLAVPVRVGDDRDVGRARRAGRGRDSHGAQRRVVGRAVLGRRVPTRSGARPCPRYRAPPSSQAYYGTNTITQRYVRGRYVAAGAGGR